ncbi:MULTISPECIES: hypothetical protein [Leptolyngbya]|uniref:hypothetical protein n=1 Tax=Leptolyngbya TaxID=47251 RepID=UPI00168A1668|nr:hypothetical protein [Leptolyngbya sp. FACHB-1624]MBD1855507.1 hypothetical protein [Leptolyngbya sp. FACHB-1624]
MKLIRLVILSAALSFGLKLSPGLAEPVTVNCSFQSDKANLRDKCQYSSSGRLSRFIPKTIVLRWSDKVQTGIEILTIESLQNGVAEGTAQVDGVDATYIKFGDGGMCFKVTKSGNSICYR